MFYNRKSTPEWTGDYVPQSSADPVAAPRQTHSVGIAEDGMINLTIHNANGIGSTLSLNGAACRQLIRMLQSTLDEHNTSED